MNKTNMKLLLEQLAHDQAYGCYTRQGLELVAWPRIAAKATYVIFADFDEIHRLNSELGYQEVDRRIKKALRVRSSDVMAIGRYYSGDEIVWVISNGDPEGMIRRLQGNLARHGLSATFASAQIKSRRDLVKNIKAAADQVQAIKKQRGSTR